MTRPAVARVFGRRLRLDEDALARIRARFAELGREMPERNRVQAELPEGATVFPNDWGTAPGFALEDDAGRFVVVLPGVPLEMERIFDAYALPFLRRRWPEGARPLVHRVLRTTGIAEAVVADRIATC